MGHSELLRWIPFAIPSRETRRRCRLQSLAAFPAVIGILVVLGTLGFSERAQAEPSLWRLPPTNGPPPSLAQVPARPADDAVNRLPSQQEGNFQFPEELPSDPLGAGNSMPPGNWGPFPSVSEITIERGAALGHREPGIPIDGGIHLQSKYRDFSMHVGGMTQVDGVWLTGNPPNVMAVPGGGPNGVGLADAVDIRRARLLLAGTIGEYYTWAFQYDFANTINDNAGQGVPNASDSPAPLNLDVTAKALPWVGNFRIGNMVTPIGLEHQQFAGFVDFMEFSYLFDAFYGQFSNGYAPGIMIFNQTADKNATISLGLYKQPNNAFGTGVGDAQGQATGRVTWTPWYDEESEGGSLMHLGLGASFQSAVQGQIRIRSRASLRNGPGAVNPILVDTSELNANGETIIAPEWALVHGPLSFQAEYCAGLVGDASVPGGPSQGTVFFQGFYFQALYFLTGEHREYDRDQGFFGRVHPSDNFYRVRDRDGHFIHSGAWQIGVRFDYLDLRDKAINGGLADDVVIGLNWLWNPNMRMQFNYMWAHRDAPQNVVEGVINGFGTRIEYNF